MIRSRRAWFVIAGAVLAPASLAAQSGLRPALQVRVLGGYVRPAAEQLSEAFQAYQAAETAGAALAADPVFRRGVARAVDGDDGFGGGVSAAVEIGAALPFGSGVRADGSAERTVGLAVHLGYDRTEAAYSTEFSQGSSGGRDELLEAGRLMLVPSFDRSVGAWSVGFGGSAGALHVRYRSEQAAAIVGPSGNASVANGGFSGAFTTWGAGVFVQGGRQVRSRLGITARVGYEYVAPGELAVTGTDVDAAVRDQNRNPYPSRLGRPSGDGTLGAEPVEIDLSGFRLHVGLGYQLRI